MATDDIIDRLAGLALFSDLSRPELEIAAHTFDEEWFPQGQRILRQGFTGTGFHLILEGEAAVVIDGVERATLGRGDFFGEISVLLDEPPTADVTAVTALHCLSLPRQDLVPWLVQSPWVAVRMLEAELRRLRNANKWRN